MASIRRSACRAAQRREYRAWRDRQRKPWRIQRDKARQQGYLTPSFKAWVRKAAKATGGNLPWARGKKGRPWLPQALAGLFKVEKADGASPK